MGSFEEKKNIVLGESLKKGADLKVASAYYYRILSYPKMVAQVVPKYEDEKTVNTLRIVMETLLKLYPEDEKAEELKEAVSILGGEED